MVYPPNPDCWVGILAALAAYSWESYNATNGAKYKTPFVILIFARCALISLAVAVTSQAVRTRAMKLKYFEL